MLQHRHARLPGPIAPPVAVVLVGFEGSRSCELHFRYPKRRVFFSRWLGGATSRLLLVFTGREVLRVDELL